MSGNVVKEFLVSLGLDIEGAADFDNTVGKATLAVFGLGAAVVAGAGAIFGFTKAIAGQLDALSDVAARAGTTADEMAELGYVAALNDSSFEAASSSVERLGQVAGEAMMGMGRGKKVFEELGISVKDANGNLKNSTDLMWEVGDAIKGMEKGQQGAVLKKLGIDPTMLGSMTADVRALRDEYQAVNQAVGLDTNAAAQSASDFEDAFGKLEFVFGAVGKALAVGVMGKFTESMTRLRKMIVDMLPRIMPALKSAIDIVLTLADVFIALAVRAVDALSGIVGWISDIISAMNGWVAGIMAVVIAWRVLNLGFLASPIGIIISLAAALALLTDDFMTWKEGGDSLIDWGQWSNEIQLVTDILSAFRGVLENMFTYIFAMVDATIKLFSGDFSGAFIAVQIAVESLASILESVFGLPLGSIKEQFASAFDWINGIIDDVMGKLRGFTDMASNAAGAVGDFLGMGDNAAAAAVGSMETSGSAPLAPSPSAASKMGNAQQTISQETNITIQGSANPESTAKAIASQQNNVNGTMVRNMKGAVR